PHDHQPRHRRRGGRRRGGGREPDLEGPPRRRPHVAAVRDVPGDPGGVRGLPPARAPRAASLLTKGRAMTPPAFSRPLHATVERAAWITIHRPEKRNALDRITVQEIAAAAERAIADPDVGVLIVTGAGEKAFVAGADIAEMAAMDAREAQAFSKLL